jgi:hypothetical protein
MFEVQTIDEQVFLGFLASRISKTEFTVLESQGDFSTFSLTYFPFESFLAPLTQRKFPHADYYEFQTAILECGLDSFEQFSRALQMYVSSLYIYCNRAKSWMLCLESDFLYREIRREINCGQSEYSKQFLKFLEWTYIYCPVDVDYDDHYFLLTWLFLMRLASAEVNPRYRDVLNYLHQKRLGEVEIEVLSTSEFKSQSWLALHQTIPLVDDMHGVVYEQIILGVK